jgi:hypothetical protein
MDRMVSSNWRVKSKRQAEAAGPNESSMALHERRGATLCVYE